MNLQRQLRKTNEIFAQEYGKPNGTDPAMAWIFSEDLWMWDNALDSEGNPIFDYICRCGRNVVFHQSTCPFTRAVYRMEHKRVTPHIRHKWVLCIWTPPPPKESWIAVYGSEDNYPERGRYLPFSSNGKTCTLEENRPPTPDDSRTVVRMRREFESKPMREHVRELRERLDRKEIEIKNGCVEQFKNALPTWGQKPGSKGCVSFPTPGQPPTLAERTA